MNRFLCVSTFFCVFSCISVSEPIMSTVNFGTANVSNVIRLDEHCMIHCDLEDLPPIIARDIPVCLSGLKPANTPQENLKLLAFLNELLLNSKDSPPRVVLKNIRRGQRFCIVADIEVDGRNLADILVENGLADKIIKVKETSKPTVQQDVESKSNESPAVEKIPAKKKGEVNVPADGFIASKSSKVFHRPSCYHVNRMDKSKAVTFKTRKEAVNTGRRPCKSCKP